METDYAIFQEAVRNEKGKFKSFEDDPQQWKDLVRWATVSQTSSGVGCQVGVGELLPSHSDTHRGSRQELRRGAASCCGQILGKGYRQTSPISAVPQDLSQPFSASPKDGRFMPNDRFVNSQQPYGSSSLRVGDCPVSEVLHQE